MEHDKLAIDLARACERLESLERWQDRQNGALDHLAGKVDTISTEMRSEFRTIRADIGARFDSIKTWLVAALTSSVLVLLVLVGNLIIGRP